MKAAPAGLPGVLLIEPDVFKDARGFFLETWQAEKYAAAGIRDAFRQDSHSLSRKDTLRGLHSQTAFAQAKLVRAVEGEIFDVAVDIREGSPTFGKWAGARLSAGNFKQMYIPAGFAHGFCVLSERAQVLYKQSEIYRPEDEIGIRFDDPDIGIDWPVKAPVLSERDKRHPALKDLAGRLPSYKDYKS